MLNFFSNVLQNQVAPLNTCTSDMDTIQGCIGCDGECLFSCFSLCANQCQGETRDTGGGSGNCNSQCTGTCFSVASIVGLK